MVRAVGYRHKANRKFGTFILRGIIRRGTQLCLLRKHDSFLFSGYSDPIKPLIKYRNILGDRAQVQESPLV